MTQVLEQLSQKTDNPHMRLLNGILQCKHLGMSVKCFLCVFQEFEMTIIYIVKSIR